MKNPENEKIIPLQNGETIKFKGITKNYGRAYWYIAAERGENAVIKNVYLIPQQQPDAEAIYKYTPEHNFTKITVSKRINLLKKVNDGRERLNCSRIDYCEIHDLVEHEYCMPASSTHLEIKESGVSGIDIRIGGKEDE